MTGEFNLRRLRVFVEVTRQGSFAAAASALNFTPSAISQQITRLEAEVGAQLVERTPRGVKLTRAGEILLTRAEAVMQQLRVASVELTAACSEGRLLRIGSFPTATPGFTAAAVAAFRRVRPDVAVRLIDDEPPHNLARLRTHQLDLAVVCRVDGRPIGSDYEGRVVCPDSVARLRTLFVEPFVAVVPEEHPLAGVAAIELADLCEETLIGTTAWPGMQHLAARCRAVGAEPRFNDYVACDYASARGLVASGEGVAVVPEMATSPSYPGTVVRRLAAEGPVREVVLALPADRGEPATVRAMIACLDDLARRGRRDAHSVGSVPAAA